MIDRDHLYLEGMLDSINRIDTYTKGVDYDFFFHNQMMIDAVIRNLEIIGEAAGKIAEAKRRKYPEIPWRKMISLRNLLIHGYFGVDESIVWEIVKTNLPEVKPWIVKAIQEVGDIT